MKEIRTFSLSEKPNKNKPMLCSTQLEFPDSRASIQTHKCKTLLIYREVWVGLKFLVKILASEKFCFRRKDALFPASYFLWEIKD